ncbi:MAG: hypothetical protein JEZ03_00795 [Bacteroidales bacterium]|nr:hypothetical protein [Bacteroidales bacterium]
MSDQIDSNMNDKCNSEDKISEEELKLRIELEKVIELTEVKNEALKKLLNHAKKE